MAKAPDKLFSARLGRAMELALLVALVVIVVRVSYGLARAGEPSSHWLWCTVGRMC